MCIPVAHLFCFKRIAPGVTDGGSSRTPLFFFAFFSILVPAMRGESQLCVVLFDIDGTLVAGPRDVVSAGVQAMAAASVAAAGVECARSGADYAGRTDPQIARMLLGDAGVLHPSRERVDALIDHYVRVLGQELQRHPYRPLGEPRRAVEGLSRVGALVGLGTGNVRSGGFLKLESAGIADLFDAGKGGFGEDGETRAELLEKGARTLDPERRLPVIIVGDTPFDVAGAHEMGARCVGVPFGQNSRERLEAAGADAVVDRIDASLVGVISSLVAEPVS
jgi:phosphoglycolate phosphatase-like HAD superfamily hydrolase